MANLLGLTQKGVYGLIHKGAIPFVRVSNRVRFIEADVLGWIEEKRVPALEGQ